MLSKLSEKIISSDAKADQIITSCYHGWKRKNFSTQEILDKEEQLRHMMKPATSNFVTQLVRNSGFSVVVPFWQNFNFIAMIALKL